MTAWGSTYGSTRSVDLRGAMADRERWAGFTAGLRRAYNLMVAGDYDLSLRAALAGDLDAAVVELAEADGRLASCV